MGVRSLGNVLASYGYKFGTTGLEAVTPEPPPPTGLTASGGVISDYEDSGTYYRSHIFTSSGTFTVSSIGDLPTSVEYVVVAGGGGGGNRIGGGGGAGGYRSSVTGESTGGGGSLETALTVSAGPTAYTVTVGSGGLSANALYYNGQPGGNSSISGPDITTVTSTGGGGGGGNFGPGAPGPTPQKLAEPGGSGGGLSLIHI